MRYRVDLRYGSASFDKRDYPRAKALYDEEGLRIVKCHDLFDQDGEVLEGAPLGVDFSDEAAS
jgi:hypothetical protein